MRTPRVAGQFYAGGKDSLRKQIEESFVHGLGPGEVPETPGDVGDILGIVVPHAGYSYSGMVAAHSYSALYGDRKPDTFVILGPNHQGSGSGVALYSKGAWKTPLGAAKIDEDLTGAITSVTEIIDIDGRAHQYEHSIEVQLPFLQYLYGEIKFAPISMMIQDADTSIEVAEDIVEAIKATSSNAVIIASTDFSHYVRAEVAEEQDREAIDRIVDMDARGLYRLIQDKGISMCGYGPVMTAIESTSRLGAKRGELIKYATSGDVMPMNEVVGYGALAFERD